MNREPRATQELMVIKLRRAYDEASPDDGTRFLIDRLWPRGVKKEALEIRAWIKDVAPSTELRQWFGHDPEKWDSFQQRYRAELARNSAAWQPILDEARSGSVTLVYSAKDQEHNDAVVLKAWLDEQLKQ